MTNASMKLPGEVVNILKALQDAGFEAFVVGGCVRDLLLEKEPRDWDITTSANPEEFQKIFPDHVYENEFGTVAVKTRSENPSLAIVEVTPYRIEGKYSDKRHPDAVRFADKLEDDLSRRDFTVNALALSEIEGATTIIDLYGGREDLKNKLIRTVGEPEKRFAEDALRLSRAVRFASTLGFKIEDETKSAIKKNAAWLKAISKERTRDEFVKIIESDNAYEGLLALEELSLLEHIVPELREGIGVTQNLHHIYTVWEHNALALRYAASKGYSLEVRLASLFHDIGKPRTKRGEGRYSTFYGHEVVGARMVAKIMDWLKFPRDISKKVVSLVRYHMFYYNVGEVTESSVRRLMVNVGPENMDDLLKMREADRIGSGRPKAVPYKLRHLKYVIDKVSHDPISVKMLKVNGKDVMRELDIPGGPKVGLILNTLLAEVLDEPSRNTREHLTDRIHELKNLTADDLKRALDKIEKAQEEEEKKRAGKYYVEARQE